MFIIQTEIDQKSMTALARMTRKTLRRGRNGPVRMLAWFVSILELFLTFLYIRAGAGWLINALLAAIMLSCILGEDYVNGAVGLRQILPASRTVNATFQDGNTYVHRTQAGESCWLYSQIMAIVEDEKYFALLLDRTHGQIYDKSGFSWGTSAEFRDFIQRKTGLNIQKLSLRRYP